MKHEDWVPVIDLAARHGQPADRRAAATAIDRACRQSGFLVVTGHGVEPDLSERMYTRTMAFFRQPADAKERIAAPPGDATRRGFHRMGKVAASIGVDTPPDLCESFSVNRLGDEHAAAAAGLLPTHPLALPNRWPDTAGFEETWSEYFAAMEGLVGLLLQLFAIALDLRGHWFDDKVDHDMSNLGANYYPVQTTPPAPGQLRKGPHTDWGSLTILLQDDAGGLEVRTTDCRWVDVPCVVDGLVVNVGDLMAIWTNDRWVSTMHRVVNPPRPSGVERAALDRLLPPAEPRRRDRLHPDVHRIRCPPPTRPLWRVVRREAATGVWVIARTSRVNLAVMADTVSYELDEHVATITYDRAEALNAINAEVREDLNAAFARFRDEEEAWVAIVTGRGRAFCVGADLKDGSGAAGVFPGTFWEKPTLNSFESGWEIFKPVIAAVNGYCLGYGLTLVTWCDFVVASDRAEFGYPEVRLGVPAAVGALRLPERIGWQHAMELLLTGERIDARRAEEIGLAGWVVPHDDLMTEGRRLAHRLTAGAPLAQRAMKEIAVRSRRLPALESVRFAETMRKLAASTDDAAEGARAAAERRPPRWQGH